MKSVLVLLLLFVNIVNTQAQKCKYDVEKKDPFSGAYLKEITNVIWSNILVPYPYLTWVSKRNGSNYMITLHILFAGERNEFMEKDDSLLIKLENDKSFIFYPSERAAPKSQVKAKNSGSDVSVNVYSIYSPTYVVSEELFKELKSSRLTYLRVNLDTNYDFDFIKTERNTKDLLKSAACILLD